MEDDSVQLSFKMPLQRSASITTTLSTIGRRANQYSNWLRTANVLILLVSLGMLFMGALLAYTYAMTNDAFVAMLHPEKINPEFVKLMPNLLIGLGSIMFVVSGIAFIFAGTENKMALMGYSIVVGLATIAMIGKANMTYLYDKLNQF